MGGNSKTSADAPAIVEHLRCSRCLRVVSVQSFSHVLLPTLDAEPAKKTARLNFCAGCDLAASAGPVDACATWGYHQQRKAGERNGPLCPASLLLSPLQPRGRWPEPFRRPCCPCTFR